MKKEESRPVEANAPQLEMDLTDPEAARKAFIASEIFNRKY